MISRARRRVLSCLRHAELVVFPSFCHLCGTLLDKPEERVVCLACLEKLRPDTSSCCAVCGRFFVGAGEPHTCLRCLGKEPAFSRHRSFARYQGELKDVILLFKFRGFSLLGKTLGRRAARFLGNDDGLWSDVDAIIPVPLHPKREVERGFNQASLLAGELARLKGIPCLDRCLVKTKNTVPQTTLAGLDREKNIRGAYSVRKAAAVQGKVILLVDDVFTTGSTLGECSSILLKAGAKDVRALTIAQA